MKFDWVGTSESSPSVGSSGESISVATGGGALRSGPLYGILRMDESEFVGLCRGVIGSGQRICLRQDCTIASHTSKKMAWMALAGEESHCMFIRGASGNDADSSSTIFSSPVLPGSYIQDAEWSELETSPRSLESWQATFSAIRDTFMSSGQDAIDKRTVADLLETTKSEIKFVFTPARKKVKLPPIQDDEMDVDRKLSPSSSMGSSVSTSSLSFVKVPHELGTQPTSAFKNLSQGAWKDLLSNVAVLKGAVEEEQSKRRGVHSRVDQQLDEIHVKLSVLHELLGERPAAFGTLSAFGLLGQLSETVESMSQTVLDIKQKESTANVHPEVHQRLLVLEDHVDDFSSEVDKLCRKQIEQFFTSGDFRNHFIDPTMKLLSRSSLTTMDPGGKWDGELSDLKTRVATLESVGPTGTPTAPTMGQTPLFAWGAGAGRPVVAPPTTAIHSGSGPVPSVALVALQEELKQLKADVKDLQDQAESDSIIVGSIVFSSRKFCDAWLLLHGADGDPHVFEDAVSLLSLATSDASLDEGHAANQRATTAKVKDKTPYHTAFIASFNLEVPPLLGKGSDSSLTTNSRALAGVPKFVDFHPPSGREGIHQRILDYVKDGRKTIEQAIGELFAFGSEPSSVSKELLLLSKTFWDDLCHWMVRYHREIKEESDASEHEVWVLISHCVRAVFKSLRDARAPGRATNTAGGMLWGTLRAHEVMREYRAHEFSGHPKIALILHEHLIRFSTPRSKFDSLQLEFSERLEKVQRSINQVVAATNKKSGGGNNKAATGADAKNKGN